MRRVLNATGILLHTNLGRAPLSEAAVRALTDAAGTTDVELDLETGARGPRGARTTAALLEAVKAEQTHAEEAFLAAHVEVLDADQSCPGVLVGWQRSPQGWLAHVAWVRDGRLVVGLLEAALVRPSAGT